MIFHDMPVMRVIWGVPVLKLTGLANNGYWGAGVSVGSAGVGRGTGVGGCTGGGTAVGGGTGGSAGMGLAIGASVQAGIEVLVGVGKRVGVEVVGGKFQATACAIVGSLGGSWAPKTAAETIVRRIVSTPMAMPVTHRLTAVSPLTNTNSCCRPVMASPPGRDSLLCSGTNLRVAPILSSTMANHFTLCLFYHKSPTASRITWPLCFV